MAFAFVLVLGMLVTGTLNTIVKKLQNESIADGIHGDPHKFTHPWFQTWVMFIGEALCLIAYGITQMMKKRKENPVFSINESPFVEEKKRSWFSFIFILPTICDLAGTTLAGIGLLYTNASVWQMLRGSIIIFSGILSVIFLKRKMYFHNWLGMGIVTAGLAVVGTSSILQNQASSDPKIGFGILLILAGQLANAIQMVVEETFLKKSGYAPLNVVGMEGLWGVIIMSIIIMPILYFIPGADNGSYENALDAFVQIGNSSSLLIFNIGYLLSIAFYNFFGLSVAKKLTSVHRTLIDACRTIFVWGLNISVYYLIWHFFPHDLPRYGEPWTDYSYVQLGGFVLLVFGTLIYNGVIKVPCSVYLTAAQQAQQNANIGKPEDERPLLTDKELKQEI
jgi:drug/metabolite transporter (DMT)-like permease